VKEIMKIKRGRHWKIKRRRWYRREEGQRKWKD
jgi:hypothetical protein